MIERSKVLVFDIEAAGVQGLKADRSFIPCFGYKWLGDTKPTVISVLDYPGKHCQDDSKLLIQVYKIISEAEALIAHFGEFFDRPFVDARFAQAGLPPIPEMKLTDTCLISRKRLCLSSYSLKNLAEFLKVKTKKMEKGRGWPDWWMGALRGDRKSIEDMSVYCGFDVQCLEEVYFAMRHIIPTRYLPINASIGETVWTCPACGGHKYNSRGFYYSEKARWKRFQCMTHGCRRWSHSAYKEAKTPKI